MILIDTGPLVALCDARDSHHRTAVTDLGRLVSNGLTTCDAVLTDTCVHLPHRTQRVRLAALLDELRTQTLPTYDATFRADVCAWLLKYADHAPDWADGCIAVLSGRDGRLRVWTYDRQFRTTWRKPDGTAMPLAVRL